MSASDYNIMMFAGVLFAASLLCANPNKFFSDHLAVPDSVSLKSAQSAETNINTDRWISVDKGFHLVGSLISTIGMSKSCIRFAEIKQKKSIWIGAGLSFTFGLSKEIRDGYQPNNFFSWKDLSADIAGILIGVALLQID